MRFPVCMLATTLMMIGSVAVAVDPDNVLDEPGQRELYEKLVDEVRCLVCQNQTIGDSSAPLAQDLRREIRDQIARGRSEAEIKEFLTERYGDFVLYRPRYGGAGSLLWLAPALLLLAGAFLLARIVRRRANLPIVDEERVDQEGNDEEQDAAGLNGMHR